MDCYFPAGFSGLLVSAGIHLLVIVTPTRREDGTGRGKGLVVASCLPVWYMILTRNRD